MSSYSYNRGYPARRASEDQDDVSPTSPHPSAGAPSTNARYNYPRAPSPLSAQGPRAPSPLSPPRPFFLGTPGERGSWVSSSSADEPNSDSESSSWLPADYLASATPTTKPQVPSKSTSASPNPIQQHQRKRTFPSTSGDYTPLNTTSEDPFSPGAVPPSAFTPSSPVHPRPKRFSLGAGAGAASPPSAFPFQAHPGNPDPLPGTSYAPIQSIPGQVSRKSSFDSLNPQSTLNNNVAGYGTGTGIGNVVQMTQQRGPQSNITGSYANSLRGGSATDLGLGMPFAPFMAGGYGHSRPGSGSIGEIGGSGSGGVSIPRTNSGFIREPFLSPASRPSSSLWAPPTNASTGELRLPSKKEPLPSSMLQRKLDLKEDKPWLATKDERASWWITVGMIFLGVAASAVYVYFGYSTVQKLPNVCRVWAEDFNEDTLSSDWTLDVELGGFGNGEFQMTTTNNSYLQNGNLYILPTLTSASIGTDNIFNGYTYNLPDCTNPNTTACSASSDSGSQSVINPVQSARLTTNGTHTMQYGRIEVRAKLPTGDWLWPAIWMLPQDDAYGPWPLSGEIDIMEARGNGPTYPDQGNNFARSTLNWGPLDSLLSTTFGWWSTKRGSFADDFHIYALEWDTQFMRFYQDSRLQVMLDISTAKQSFFEKGGYPATAQNGSEKVVVENPWASRGNNAPFDQPFYLIIDLAVGGTNGFFPDNIGGKPWFDADDRAMTKFALAQDQWSATWPSNPDDLAFRIDYVYMYDLC